MVHVFLYWSNDWRCCGEIFSTESVVSSHVVCPSTTQLPNHRYVGNNPTMLCRWTWPFRFFDKDNPVTSVKKRLWVRLSLYSLVNPQWNVVQSLIIGFFSSLFILSRLKPLSGVKVNCVSRQSVSQVRSRTVMYYQRVTSHLLEDNFQMILRIS